MALGQIDWHLGAAKCLAFFPQNSLLYGLKCILSVVKTRVIWGQDLLFANTVISHGRCRSTDRIEKWRLEV